MPDNEETTYEIEEVVDCDDQQIVYDTDGNQHVIVKDV